MIAAEASRSMESTVDMIAASGPAMNTPAQGAKAAHDQRGHGQDPAAGQIGDDGAAERPGQGAHAQEEEPVMSVPMIMASCMDRESL